MLNEKKLSNFIKNLHDRKASDYTWFSSSANKGFSLVELIIAVAILAIVMTGVTSFMVIGTRNYSNANNEVTVQQEVQQAVNQIADAIIDASWSVGIEPKYTAVGENTIMLAVYNGIPDDPSQPSAPMTVLEGREKNYIFYWKDSGETMTDPYDSTKELKIGGLWYTEFSAADLEIGADAVTCLLADKVTEFVVDTSQAASKNVVGVSLEVVRGNRVYTASANVTIRNKVAFNAYIPEYNDEDLPSISISAPLVIYLEPGDGYSLKATVNGENVDTLGYHWEDAAGNLLSEGETAISIEKDSNNALNIGGTLLDDASYKSEHIVYAVSDAVDSKGKSARSMPVRIRVRRVKEVKIDPVSETISKGETFNMTGTVTGDYLDRVCSACGEDEDTYKLSTTGNYCFKYSEDGGVTWKDCGSDSPFSVGVPTYSGNSFSVPVTLNSTVKTGTYTLRVYSYDSVNKNGGYNAVSYNDRVRGELVLTTKGGSSRPRRSNIGRLTYGSAADLGYGVFGQYANLFLAVNIFDENGEWVRTMLLNQPGNNMRLDPDYFGINWTRDYIVQIELFSAGDYPDSIKEDFKNDYLSHLDENYCYNGTKYEMIYAYEGYMTPPSVNLRDESTGITYSSAPFTIAAIKVGTQALPQVLALPCSGMEQESANYVGVRVQRFENGEWVDYGYGGMAPSGGSGDMEFTLKQGIYTPAEGKSIYLGGFSFAEINMPRMTFKMDPGDKTDKPVGQYRCIPYIVYRLGTMNKNSYIRDNIFYSAGSIDTNEYSMECPQSTFYFNIITTTENYNVKNLWTYINSEMKEGDLYFPLPSSKAEFEKYFKGFDESKTETLEYTTESNFEFSSNGSVYGATFSKISCTYDKTADQYSLTFFYNAKNYNWGRNAYNVETATYTWKSGDSAWTKSKVGPLDPAGPDMDSTIKNVWVFWGTPQYVNWKKGNMYIPLPWEEDFKTNIGVSNTKTRAEFTFTSDFAFRYDNDTKSVDGELVLSKVVFTCDPDSGSEEKDRLKDKYYVEVYYSYTDPVFGEVKDIKAGKWEATINKSTSKVWSRVAGDEGSGQLDADLENGVTSFSFPNMSGVTICNYWSVYEANTVYPLPGEDSFTFKEESGTQTKSQSLIFADSWGNKIKKTFDVECLYDASEAKYTLTLKTMHDNGTTVLTSVFEAPASGATEWTKVS